MLIMPHPLLEHSEKILDAGEQMNDMMYTRVVEASDSCRHGLKAHSVRKTVE